MLRTKFLRTTLFQRGYSTGSDKKISINITLPGMPTSFYSSPYWIHTCKCMNEERLYDSIDYIDANQKEMTSFTERRLLKMVEAGSHIPLSKKSLLQRQIKYIPLFVSSLWYMNHNYSRVGYHDYPIYVDNIDNFLYSFGFAYWGIPILEGITFSVWAYTVFYCSTVTAGADKLKTKIESKRD